MLFINGDMSSFPYAKLLGTISGSFAAYYACCFWNLKLRIKNEKFVIQKIELLSPIFLFAIKTQHSLNTTHLPQQDN